MKLPRKFIFIICSSLVIGFSLSIIFSYNFYASSLKNYPKSDINFTFKENDLFNYSYFDNNIDETYTNTRKFPPDIADQRVVILTSKSKKILLYWIKKNPREIIHWANSKKYIRLPALRYIFYHWLERDTKLALKWLDAQNNKEELYSLVNLIGKHGKFDYILEHISQNLYSYNKELYQKILQYFLASRINKNYEKIKKWIDTIEDKSIIGNYLYVLARYRTPQEAFRFLEKKISEEERENFTFNHPFYKKIYSGYLKNKPLNAIVEIIDKEPLSRGKPHIYFPYLLENAQHINILLKKNYYDNQYFLKMKNDRVKNVISIVLTTELAISDKISLSNVNKKISQGNNFKLIRQAYIAILNSKSKAYIRNNPEDFIAIIEKYNIIEEKFITDLFATYKEETDQVFKWLKLHHKFFYNTQIYGYLAKELASIFNREILTFSKEIDDEHIYTAYISNLIKYVDLSNDLYKIFSPYCDRIKDYKLHSHAYVTLSQRLLQQNKANAINLFFKNYTKESQIVLFFHSLLKIDPKLAINILHKYNFTGYTKSILIGLISYYNLDISSLMEEKFSFSFIKEKVILAKALQKFKDKNIFFDYVDSLSTNDKNKVLIYFDKFLKRM